ncbi:ABC transporter substrate-binding protein [Corynebacterium sp. NML 150383]|uniref:ABC transporter substrate-binding protein n=1 Tax=unclassified Corynebacterium TaxID=2624378 RepID=UPI000BAA4A5A|nr:MULTISPECIES: ABC transporter substrate-binding protein [unclassified Corynebacterium]PAT03693.1 ABC transporter substrate-binding protein [Corynebacterium sp. NML 150383]TVX77118.1 carbohydrate ABC transporter substrate-binding protein [Corynebacterium sp. NML180780]
MSTTTRAARRVLATVATVMVASISLVACGTDNGPSVYYLNFKPEQAEQFKTIAAEYTEETGIPVKVVTAASGSYMQTLKAEMAKSNAPTLFQVNGQEGYGIWKDYLADLSDYEVVQELNDDAQPITDKDGAVRAVPYALEGFGILYNEEIFDQYFALPNPAVGSMAEVNNFGALKAVAEDMQAKKEELGIDGAFAVTSLIAGEEWRWTNHLMNGPYHYEIQDRGITEFTEMPTIDFIYGDQYKQMLDLYLNNSTTKPALAASRSTSDSMAEFATGKAAMVQNGSWAWSQIGGEGSTDVKEDKIKFMPIYMGLPDEENVGLNIGTEAYMAVNNKASEEDQQATRDFLNWLFLSDQGKQHVVNDLSFIAPFKNYGPEDVPDDPLAHQVQAALTDEDSETIPWDFQFSPNQQFRDLYGQNLAQYAIGNMSWDDVVAKLKEDWEYEMANQIALLD